MSEKTKYRILEGKHGIEKAYNEMAPSYDTSKSSTFFWTRKMEAAEERVVNKWIKNFKDRILDVGCGTGRYTVKIAKNSEVVAIDLSLNMLKQTREKAEKNNSDKKINLIRADGEHLPLKGESFNGLISTLAFDHFQKPHLAAEDFSRVLKRNGTCIIGTFNNKLMKEFKKRHNLPHDKIPFKAENMTLTLIYEVGHSVKELEEMFSKHGLYLTDVKGCCYWHAFPDFINKIFPNYSISDFYDARLDSFFNHFNMIDRADIQIVNMRKR